MRKKQKTSHRPPVVKPQKHGRIFGWKNIQSPVTLIDEKYHDGNEHAIVVYYPNNMTKKSADALQCELEQHNKRGWIKAEPWKYMNKSGWTRRKSVAFGEEGLSYTYAGKTRVAIGWQQSPLLYELKKQLQQDTGQMLNYALVNLYPDGEADIPWHSDKEQDMAQDSLIVSVSLGEERPFQFKPKSSRHPLYQQTKGGILTIDPLKHGSVLIMNMDTQHYFLHSLPKRSVKKYNQPRYNITFRLMQGNVSKTNRE